MATFRQYGEIGHPRIPITQQCELLGLSCSGYYAPQGESELSLLLRRLIDGEYTAHSFFGYRKMLFVLHQQGHTVNHKRIERLMWAMVPGKANSIPVLRHQVYSYLLRGMKIEAVNQV